MIVLPTLRTLLQHGLSPPEVHTAALFTPPGALISYATGTRASPAQPGRPFGKDDVRLLVGLASEVWAEARTSGGIGMAECEVSARRGGSAGGHAPSALPPSPSTGGALTTSRPQLGRIVVVPVYSAHQLDALSSRDPSPDDRDRHGTPDAEDAGPEPLLLLAVQGSMDADWDDLLASVAHPLSP